VRDARACPALGCGAAIALRRRTRGEEPARRDYLKMIERMHAFFSQFARVFA
jgi:hypothetical protein